MMAGFDENGTLDAAVLLLALGEETAAEVFKHLTPKEVQSLGEVMARTQYTTKDHVNRVLERFHEVAAGQSTLVDDSNAYVQGVLRRALGEEKAGMLIDRITHGSDVTGIESLRWMDAASISELVRNEHPQIIASILVHLERDQASAILLQLSEELRADVVLRIATLDGIQPNALKELNEALSRVLAGGEQVKRSRLGGSKTAAEASAMLTLYQSSKAGLERFSASLRDELAPDGIRVTLLRAAAMMGDDMEWKWPPELARRFMEERQKIGIQAGNQPVSEFESVAEVLPWLIALPGDVGIPELILDARHP